ncbi:hypothetical protein [Amycolatopsis sp. cmx-11-51]|uniref:hypothetical protein n=1 Tax=Amycolatopsis sp. cmx-11-51 TaxID=2785797 RepID=UPI0039E34804
MEELVSALSYAPDGLYESDIDAMIAEYFVTTHDQEIQVGPPSVSDRVATHRHVRRISRQAVSSTLRARPDSSAA